MEKSNYAEALTLLNHDKRRLLSELEVIDVAINALTSLSLGGEVQIVKNSGVTNNANGSTINKSRKNYYEDVDVTIHDQYDSELTPIEQVIYALNKIGSGTIEDIAGCVVKVDTTKDYEKVFTRYREIASGLYRAGKINADTRKKKYRYSLKGGDGKPKIDSNLLTELDNELDNEFIYDKTE